MISPEAGLVTAVHSSRRPSYLNAAMITPCARVMAVATFATTRCGSFLYGGSRFARTGAKQFAALHSSAHVEQTTKDHESLSRGNADDASLDSLLISTNPDLVVDHMKARRTGEDSVEAVHRIGDLMDTRRELIMTKEDALKQRNAMSAQIGKLMKAGQAKEAEEKKNEVQNINKIAGSAEEDLNEVDSELNTLLMRLPNLLDSRVPDGDGEEENVVVAEWGQEYIKNGEEYLWHDEVAIKLGGWDPEGAARISGARFSVLKGPLARLERALGQWLLDVHTTEHGYTEVSLPLLVTRSSLEGTGQLPKFEEDLFKTNHLVANEDSFLIPTGEVPLTNLLRGQLLDKAQLPMSLVALTPCFRAEAGSAGRDTRGLLRQHQFLKVELVKFTTPEDSRNEHEALTQHAEAVLKAAAPTLSKVEDGLQLNESENISEKILPLISFEQALKLPFRRVSLCSGDIGFGARLCYDLEVWMPGQGAFREISSCSNCQDFQARRMNLRYREPTPEAKKKKSRNLPCHTINGSGVAVGRALVAVLENYYNPIDGSVSIPDVLRPYMGGAEKLECVPQ